MLIGGSVAKWLLRLLVCASVSFHEAALLLILSSISAADDSVVLGGSAAAAVLGGDKTAAPLPPPSSFSPLISPFHVSPFHSGAIGQIKSRKVAPSRCSSHTSELCSGL